ncbi:hypothetical protein MMC24_003589 [Lignoscripta atroalba]|nr:hypothetical protein [Lignoscripta atroalba]
MASYTRCSVYSSFVLLLLGLFETGCFAAPVDSGQTSVITSSGDAWATLVANIAPLLILVGEKHVKAYFKTMFRQSDFILYAASPIGLITALVTLIRLYGNPLMKKIIGRQFETRAEVLADVTSVSNGDVSLEFRKDRSTLEQSTTPSADHEAIFGVYTRKKGNGEALMPILLKQYRLVHDYGATIHRNRRKILWYSINILRTHGEDCITVSRDLTANYYSVDRYLDGVPQQIQSCEFVSDMYIEGTGVSPALTANAGGPYQQTNDQRYRYLAGSICVCLNIAIVITNGIVYGNALTSTLIAVGMAGSFFGSWKTAYLVYRATEVAMFSLRDLEVLRAGFFSETDDQGSDMTPLPRSIAISQARRFRPSISVVISTVIISSLAFVSLYLGLRAAAWWIPLLMLANVALTSCMRAFLSEDLILTRREASRWGFSTFRQCHGLCPHMFVGNADSTLHDQIGLCRQNSRQVPKNTNSGTSCHQNAEPKLLQAWTVISIVGNISPHPSPPMISGRISVQERDLIINAFAVVLALQTKGLQPRKLDIEHNKGRHTRYIRSEFLAMDGVWQQDLDLDIGYQLYLSDKPPFLEVPYKVAALLRIWATAALVGEHNMQKNCTFAPFTQSAREEQITAPSYPCDLFIRAHVPPQEPEIYQLFRTAQRMAKDGRELWFRYAELWSNKVMLWMTVKIIFALEASWLRPQDEDFPTVCRSQWEALAEECRRHTDPNVTTATFYDRRDTTRSCRSENIPLYVDCLQTAGLVERVGGTNKGCP